MTASGGAPVVSVAIAAYRADAFIAMAVRSALDQTLSHIEVIVADDASPDGTAAAAEAAGRGDPRLRVLRLAVNGGPSAARNAAFAAARGRFVAVLDADDAFAPDRLARLVAFADREGADIAADGLLVTRDLEADPGAPFALRVESPISLAAYAVDNRLFAPGGGSGYLKPLFRKSFLEAHGLTYRADMRIAEDWDLCARALACGARFVVTPEPGYRYRVHDGSISHRLTADHVERMIEADDAFRSAYGATLDAAARKGLDRRRASLEDGLAFQRAIEALKSRAAMKALMRLAARPQAIGLMAQPVEAMLRRLVGAAPRRHVEQGG